MNREAISQSEIYVSFHTFRLTPSLIQHPECFDAASGLTSPQPVLIPTARVKLGYFLKVSLGDWQFSRVEEVRGAFIRVCRGPWLSGSRWP
jgi:hypothetical protein